MLSSMNSTMPTYRIPSRALRHAQPKIHVSSRRQRPRTESEESGPQLPLELYHHIMSFIEPKETQTLRSLALVCKSLNPEAESYLYHTLGSNNRKLSDSLLRALIKSPRQASYVRRIYVRISICNAHLLRQALETLSNLVSLSFEGFRPIDRILLQTCHFPKLEKFEWVGLDEGEVYIKFFEAHPQLLEVHVEWPKATVVPKTILPNVRTVSGEWNSLKVLLPGRKIRKINAEGLMNGIMKKPVEKGPFTSVDTLIFGGFMPIPAILELFPHVKVLKLRNLAITADLVPQLCQAPFLSCIALDCRLGMRVFQKDRMDMAEQLFDACPKLESVDIRDPVEGCFRLTKFSQKEVRISFGEFWEPYDV